MNKLIISLITACLGSIGFSVMYRTRLRYIPLCAAGGLLNWVAFLLCDMSGLNFLLCNLLASVVTALYSEAAARLARIPVTIVLIPSVIPLIPGGSLYYAFESLIRKDYTGFASFFYSALLAAAGISIGIVTVSLLWRIFVSHKHIYNTK